MADSALTGGSGAGGPIRVLTNLGAGLADQQVITLADSAGNLLGTTGAPLPVATRGMSVTGQTFTVAANTPLTGAALDVSPAGNLTVFIKNAIAATPFTGAVVVAFEQSDDATSWGPLPVARSDTGALQSVHTVQPLAASTSIVFNAALPGVNYVRARVTTAPTANNMTVVLQPGGGAFQPTVSTFAPTRTPVHMLVDGIAAVAAEALVSYGGFRAGTALTAGTGAYVVPAGKTLRIQQLAVWGTGTAIDRVRVRVRALATTVVATSPIYAGTAVTFGANSGASSEITPADGIEIPAGFQVGITVIGATTSTWGVNLSGYEY